MHQDFSRAFILFNYGPPTKIQKLKNAINCKPNKIMIIVCLSKQKYLKCLKLITHPNQWNVFETSRIASTRQDQTFKFIQLLIIKFEVQNLTAEYKYKVGKKIIISTLKNISSVK